MFQRWRLIAGSAQSALQRATLLGATGIAIGLAGVVFGVVALVSRRQRVATVDTARTDAQT